MSCTVAPQIISARGVSEHITILVARRLSSCVDHYHRRERTVADGQQDYHSRRHMTSHACSPRRRSFWHRKINSDSPPDRAVARHVFMIEGTVSSCATCCANRHPQSAEPLLPHPTPLYPWKKIGGDIFTLIKRDYLLVIDYFRSLHSSCPLLTYQQRR